MNTISENKSIIDFSSKDMHPFTLIYLVDTKDNKVLLIKKKRNRLIGKWLGLGGKIEPGESVIESAKREFLAESGLTILDPAFRGTLHWINEKEVGILYIFVATKYSGTLSKDCDEGELQWYDIQELDTIKDLADHQEKFLKEILTDDTYFYAGSSLYQNGKRISYTDSSSYFEKRKIKK